MELQLAGLFGFGGGRMGGRGAPKDVTGLEPARSTCSTCGGVGSLGDSKVGCCDFGIDNSLVHGGEGGKSAGVGFLGRLPLGWGCAVALHWVGSGA